jgi:hypothetical protein
MQALSGEEVMKRVTAGEFQQFCLEGIVVWKKGHSGAADKL